MFALLVAAPLLADCRTERLRIALIPKKSMETLIGEYRPLVFSGELCPELKQRISELMLADPLGLAAFFASQQATGLVAADHADYGGLLRYLAR